MQPSGAGSSCVPTSRPYCRFSVSRAVPHCCAGGCSCRRSGRLPLCLIPRRRVRGAFFGNCSHGDRVRSCNGHRRLRFSIQVHNHPYGRQWSRVLVPSVFKHTYMQRSPLWLFRSQAYQCQSSLGAYRCDRQFDGILCGLLQQPRLQPLQQDLRFGQINARAVCSNCCHASSAYARRARALESCKVGHNERSHVFFRAYDSWRFSPRRR
mmetsp:Transcript_108796/g.204099  ORF Transcript_108796/g.204099 Transcript_108796/m.204099 type:complete len:209 (+) Transcript_108796:48-674(+)